MKGLTAVALLSAAIDLKAVVFIQDQSIDKFLDGPLFTLTVRALNSATDKWPEEENPSTTEMVISKGWIWKLCS